MMIEYRNHRDNESDPDKIAIQLLESTIKRAAAYIRSLSINESYKSELNINTLFKNAIKDIAASSEKKDNNKKSILEEIKEIEEASIEYAKYNILPKVTMPDIVEIVEKSTESEMNKIAPVLNSYLNSIRSKYNTLSTLVKRMHSLSDILESFLNPKKIKFTIRKGLVISSENGKILEPKNLSSGERQLLLLFLNTLVTLDRPCVIMIDEPELSLNITWQRKLIQSLTELSQESSTQFIFASHSFEILSNYMDDTIKLGIK